jgi:hypothetical protein
MSTIIRYTILLAATFGAQFRGSWCWVYCAIHDVFGGGITRYVSFSGYLHLCNIDSGTCYLRLSILSFYKPQGIWKSIDSSYTTCVVSSGIWRYEDSSLLGLNAVSLVEYFLTFRMITVSPSAESGDPFFRVIFKSWCLNFCNYRMWPGKM